MKHIKFLSVLLVSIASMSMNASAQMLPEIKIVARNYKYLRSVDNQNVAQPVKLLERRAASYDVKQSEYYEDDYDTYAITFYLPQGYILATYDSSGKLIRTAERFKGRDASRRCKKCGSKPVFPNWAITNDVYKVTYEEGSGAKLAYQLVLKNGSKRVKVRVDENGGFLN